MMSRTSFELALFGALLLVMLCGACKTAGEAALEEAVERAPGLRIRFEGGETFSRTELLDALATDLRELSADGIDRPDVDDLAYVLEVFHRTHGFPDAYVSYLLDDAEGSEADGKQEARFRIEEGRRVEIAAFSLIGNEDNADPGFADERMREFFAPPSGLFAEGPWWFVWSRIERGASALEGYYRARGFLSARVLAPRLEWMDEGRTQARIVVTVQEGPRWVLAEATLDTLDRPGRELPEDRKQALEWVLEHGRRGAEDKLLPYTLRLAYGLRAQILERLGQWGRLDATCTVEETELGDGRMGVRFVVDPGPIVRVGEIVASGNEKTRVSFLRSRLTLEEGDLVDSRELRASFSRLFETGLFRTVSITAKKREGESETAPEVFRDLALEVLELPSLELTVEPGYGSYERLRARLSLVDSNLFGRGRTARLDSTLGDLAQEVSFGLGDRALFDSDYSGSASVYLDRREEPSFTLQEQGFALSVGRSWRKETVETSLGYRFRRTDLSEVEIVDDLVEEALADVNISSIALTIARDTRDRFFVPSSGSFLRTQLEWASTALGSEIDFLAGRLEGATFRELPWEGGVLGAGFETGLIAPIGETDVLPLQVRMFNGGENTVRSFREDELGRLDENGEAIGGEAYSVFSLELRQHIAGPLSTALFYDAGNLEPDHEQFLDFDDMRQALGVGLRYALPIGPIRLDAGWNPDAREQEDDWVIHLSVGMSF